MEPKNRRKPLLYSYLAGYFEGEGSVSIIAHKCESCISNGGKTCTMQATIGSTELDILTICRKHFGGSICKEDRSKQGNYKDIYRWVVASKKALTFLEELLPYLRTKKKKEAVSIGIKFQKHKSNGSSKKYSREYFMYEDKLVQKLRKVNKRGREQ